MGEGEAWLSDFYAPKGRVMARCQELKSHPMELMDGSTVRDERVKRGRNGCEATEVEEKEGRGRERDGQKNGGSVCVCRLGVLHMSGIVNGKSLCVNRRREGGSPSSEVSGEKLNTSHN